MAKPMPIIPIVTVDPCASSRMNGEQPSRYDMMTRQKALYPQANASVLKPQQHFTVSTTRFALLVTCLMLVATTGCQTFSTSMVGVSNAAGVANGLAAAAATGDPSACLNNGEIMPASQRPPAELTKMTLPTYRIEPPDTLLLEAIRVIPKQPYLLRPLDSVQIVASGTPIDQPIFNVYTIDADGSVNLGPAYGSVQLEGLSTEEARDEIARILRRTLVQSDVAVTLIQASGQQQIFGEHQVSPDGTISLGIYGRVQVAGMTVDEARYAIEEKMSEFFEAPEISVDIFGYNSKVFYVITEGPGDGVQRLPITGNETVLDAIATLGGIGSTSSKRIWISRPAPHGVGCDQVLPVDWNAITKGANTCTNYQMLPGDRLFIAQDRLVALDNFISKILNPFERSLGFTLLGSQTIQSIQQF
jgi:polysaccharide export outer membrane protein